MTTLTQANQVHPVIRFTLVCKFSEWSPMVNRETFADALLAVRASSALLFYNQRSCLIPTLSPVRCLATHPIRGVLAALLFVTEIVPAGLRAKLSFPGVCSRGAMWRPLEIFAAAFTGLRCVFNKTASLVLAWSKPRRVIHGWLPDAIKSPCVLTAQASPRTKPLSFHQRRLDHHFSAASLTLLFLLLVFAHLATVAHQRRLGNSGTTGMVSLELGRKAILIELNPAYVELQKRRCDVTPGLALV